MAAELPLLEPLGVKAEAEELGAAEPVAPPPAGPLDDLQALLAGEAPTWLVQPKQQQQPEAQQPQQQKEQQQEQAAEQRQQQQDDAAPADVDMADAAAADGAAPSAAGGEAADGAAAAAPSEAGGGEASGPPGEDDALAADLLSNMAAWQSELDTFTVRGVGRGGGDVWPRAVHVVGQAVRSAVVAFAGWAGAAGPGPPGAGLTFLPAPLPPPAIPRPR